MSRTITGTEINGAEGIAEWAQSVHFISCAKSRRTMLVTHLEAELVMEVGTKIKNDQRYNIIRGCVHYFAYNAIMAS